MERLCKNCGGDLLPIDGNKYKCRFCGVVYEKETVTNYANEMRDLFDEAKLEAISNARRNLYETVNAEYISSEAVRECCVALKQLLPNDSQASFYEIAVGKNLRQLTKAIRKINVNEDGADIESVVNFLIRSLQTEYQLELNNLIARAFENTDPVKFEKYCTMLSEEAEKVDNGVYETKLPREVFVAYSSKDMEKVSELVEMLEAQGLKCFVAARNLRHGKGAVESYNKALEEAMDHCRSLVFVSSTNSRSFNCDALTIELPYVQAKDTENAPAEYKNNYKAIPRQYKKPRVEYRIGESVGFNVADVVSNEIFDGYERAYTPEEVAERVVKQLVANTKTEPKVEKAKETKKVKYCVECKSECPEDARFCMNCGGKSFASSIGEAELMQKIAMLEKEKAELESRKAEAAHVSVPTPKPEPVSKSDVILITEFEFTSNGDKTCRISGIRVCADTEVVIPLTSPAGDKVTSIGKEAFKDCSSLTSITIPDSVTSIGDHAFYNCSGLTSITIPDSVTSIGQFAFRGCTSLTSIMIPDSVTSIGQFAFHGCASLISITIPDSVTSIAQFTFHGCTSLASITVPADVTSIGGFAFCNCSSLTSITIPAGVTSIGGHAFCGCTSLASITIPTGVTSIGYSTFRDCSSLVSITISDRVTTIGYSAFCGCASLKSIVIPDSVTSIGEWAFHGCASLTSITIPDSVTSIGYSTFDGCTSLNSITIPDSVTSIGYSAFSGCASLTNITIPDSVTKIGYSAFNGCSSLTKIIFNNPIGWKKLGGGLFSNISENLLADPRNAAEALKTKYKDIGIERK